MIGLHENYARMKNVNTAHFVDFFIRELAIISVSRAVEIGQKYVILSWDYAPLIQSSSQELKEVSSWDQNIHERTSLAHAALAAHHVKAVCIHSGI